MGGNGDSGLAIISPDGRYVLFGSAANNLTLTANSNPIPVLIPAHCNVYLRDRTNGTTSLVSVNLSGTGGGSGDSFADGISSNGWYALFESSAPDLTSGDTNHANDVFIRDLVNGTNILASVSTNGGFGNGNSGPAVMTPDGRYVAFVSSASNLVPGDTNGIPDIFVRDMQSGTTMLASPGAKSTGPTAGSYSAGPLITPDGRFVAFYSSATNLVSGVTNVGDIYVRDLTANATYWASTGARAQLQVAIGKSNGVCFSHKINATGTLVAYEVSPISYTNTVGVVLQYNLSSGQTLVVNTNANAPVGAYEDLRTLDMSPDGRFVASVANTDTQALNTVVYFWDEVASTNVLVSADVSNAVPVSGTSYAPLVDPSGRYVVFLSNSTNLTTNVLTGEYHLYCRDTQLGTTVLVDANTNGVGVGVTPAGYPNYCPGTQLLAYESDAALDRNHFMNILVFNFLANATELVSIQSPAISSPTPDGQSVLSSTAPVSLNGQYVVLASDADNLVANDTNGYRDVFVRDLISGTNILVSTATNGLPAAGVSSEASISANGRYVAFSSSAANLVSRDANIAVDVFERDLQNGTTTLVSQNMYGSGSGNGASYSPIVSSDGRFILFRSLAQNLARGSFGSGVENLFLRDLQLGTNYALTASSSTIGGVYSAAMSPDGHYVAFIGTLSGTASSFSYFYVWDSQRAAIVYTNSASGLQKIIISPDGQRLVYSTASALFIIDRANPANNATVATGLFYASEWGGNFSADGNWLALNSIAPISAKDTNNVMDIYLYNVLAKTNFLVSQNLNGTGAGDGASDSAVISPDGRFVAYRSAADNLVPGDSNGVPDVLIYDRTAGTTTLLSPSQFGNRSADSRSLLPCFSGDGQTIVFESAASDLVTNDWNRASDVYAFNLYNAGMISTFYVQRRIARFCRSNQRNTPDEVCRKTSRNLPQFRHATDFHPFDNKDISFVIKVGTVRRDELAGNEMVAGERPQILVAGAFAKVRDELVIFIEQRDA